jgi:hypothetical protein
MFPDERVFLVTDHLGHKVSTIVQDRDFRQLENDSGSVEVRILGVRGEITLVMLPGDILGPSRTISVRTSELENGARNGTH